LGQKESGENMSSPKKDLRSPRWATRLQAMEYSQTGATKFNELMQQKKITAKKDGNRIKVDLNSIDDLFASLPDVAKG
jgi:hypothetical protein